MNLASTVHFVGQIRLAKFVGEPHSSASFSFISPILKKKKFTHKLNENFTVSFLGYSNYSQKVNVWIFNLPFVSNSAYSQEDEIALKHTDWEGF